MKLHDFNFEGQNGESYQIEFALDHLAALQRNAARVTCLGIYKENPTADPVEITFTMEIVQMDGGQDETLDFFVEDRLIASIPLNDHDRIERFLEAEQEQTSPFDKDPWEILTEGIDAEAVLDTVDGIPLGDPMACLIKAGIVSTAAQFLTCRKTLDLSLGLAKKTRALLTCLGQNITTIAIKTTLRTLRCVAMLG